jgi:uncharacterized protein YbcI
MTTGEAQQVRGDALAAVSSGIVSLFSRYYGRGPTKARTYAFDRYLLTVLQDPLTTVERTLLSSGRGDLVRDVRLTFQEAMADEFMGVVTEVTGRRVATYHSQVTLDPPICFEIFVLED